MQLKSKESKDINLYSLKYDGFDIANFHFTYYKDRVELSSIGDIYKSHKYTLSRILEIYNNKYKQIDSSRVDYFNYLKDSITLINNSNVVVIECAPGNEIYDSNRKFFKPNYRIDIIHYSKSTFEERLKKIQSEILFKKNLEKYWDSVNSNKINVENQQTLKNIN